MNLTLPVRPSSYEEIVADPLFRDGYNHAMDGIGGAPDIRWSDGEQEAYERGRQFGAVVKSLGEGRIPLTRGYLAHPRARLLLTMAMQSGEVL